MRVRLTTAAAVASLAVATPLLAHHSGAAYSSNMVVLKEAVVITLMWVNPHSILSVDVKNGEHAGKWNLEAGSPSALTRMGWSRTSVKQSDVVVIELYPARTGAKVGRLKRVTLADGRELLDSQTSREAPTAP